ncbi:toll/interleukin-1 receptor domain-containing protein [Amycolatopsis nigrescens]|uniref:toll/interleukin-1 receptor domain-containing protein n=1 Tax=Amycolatopsis nigrescens TaxID=381445 RepID=UPI0003A8918C|nr:toll/interleukin-1 receptor domain-containing protein [Amycolatopsis nigrescens]
MTESRYHAFISYRSTARRAAKRLKHDLYAIAKRHAAGTGFAVYLDTSDLRPGPLSEEILTAVAQSRCLIVLLDRTTVESSWVAQEISHWLDSGGSPERLFLVRLDPELNLDWDPARGTFREPDALPAPLRELFEVEQKWIELADRSLFRGHEGLAALCAALMDVDANEYLLEEATYQRGRTRTITAVAVVMTLLFGAAAIGAIAAVNNQREAERNAEQARAQADASEALLAAEDSPTLAIERALRAARRDDGPTVRSAMLAVSQAARRLQRALVYPEAETGHPATGTSFSADGARLVAWGAGRERDTSALRVWEVDTGRVAATVTTDVTDLRDITFLGSNHLAACSAAGPVLIELAAAKTTRLGPPGRTACEVHSFADGVILLNGGGTAYLVDVRGTTVTFDGVDSVAAHPKARAAVVAGPAGVAVVAGGKRLPLTASAAWSARFADGHGGFLVASGAREWGVVTLQGGVPSLRTWTVPADAADVAPLLKSNRLTGDLAWITADGTIGWTRDDRRTKVEDPDGYPRSIPLPTRLEPLASENFVALHDDDAAVVRSPGELPPNAEEAWTQVAVKDWIVAHDGGPPEPIAARCAERSEVMIHTDVPENGSLLIDGNARTDRIDGRGEFTGRIDGQCDAVAIGRSLSAIPQLGDEPVVLRGTLVADTVAVAPVGDRVALLKPGFAIEILSTLTADSLPKPWDVTTEQGGAVTALGERQVFPRSEELVIAGATGVVDRVPLPASAELLAARPDGTGAALAEYGSKRAWLVDGRTVLPSDACTDKSVSYLPGPDFATSRADAEAQIPVARVDDSQYLDCRDGRTVSSGPRPEILSYEIGAGTGRIVARAGNRTTVTTWPRDGGSGVTTMDGPPLLDERSATSFDEAGRLALTYTPGARDVTLYRRDTDGWTRRLNLATRLPRIAAAQTVDGGTLVLAVSTTGGFELFDAETGRLLAADLGLSLGQAEVEQISSRRAGDMLSVSLRHKGSTRMEGTIRIPVGVPALKRQLCSLHPAADCP